MFHLPVHVHADTHIQQLQRRSDNQDETAPDAAPSLDNDDEGEDDNNTVEGKGRQIPLAFTIDNGSGGKHGGFHPPPLTPVVQPEPTPAPAPVYGSKKDPYVPPPPPPGPYEDEKPYGDKKDSYVPPPLPGPYDEKPHSPPPGPYGDKHDDSYGKPKHTDSYEKFAPGAPPPRRPPPPS